jgi:N-ethylmaleimide reductase
MQELYSQTDIVKLTWIMAAILFSPVRVGPFALANRIVIVPMSRNRAGPGNTPTGMDATYHARRAGAQRSEENGREPT